MNSTTIKNLAKIFADYELYARTLLKIRTKKQKLTNLAFNNPQKRLHQAIESHIKKAPDTLPRVIVLKARQEGISTYAEGRIFWYTHTNENTESRIIAHENEAGENIFKMCRLFYEELPAKLRPMLKYSTKKELTFENPNKKTYLSNPGLRSKLSVLTAGKKEAGRSQALHHLHASELASWQFPENIVPALLPTIPLTKNNFIIYESTAKGVGNFFHKEWLAAEQGESNFFPHFIPWFELPEYSAQFNTEKDKAIFIEALTEEEKELIALYSLTPEQLLWRRLEIRNLSGDVELFRQEFPCSPEEAFIVTGSPIFDRIALREMSRAVKKPIWRGFVDIRQKLVADEKGELKIWEFPKRNSEYVIGADIADGGEDGDYSCAIVWKKAKFPFIAHQVAEWHGRVDPYSFAKILDKLGNYYNIALIAPETNSFGQGTAYELSKTYGRLFRPVRVDKLGATYKDILGWQTTLHSKKLLVAYMSHCVAKKLIFINSIDLIRECMTFVRDSLNTAGSAAGKGHDDRVMAAMIGLYALQQEMLNLDESDVSIMFSSTADPVPKEKILSKVKLMNEMQYRIDPDLEQIIEEPYESYGNSWLNL